ncbi:hypothetical protein ABZ572_32035 [Streptomyces sp. NPDC018338]|uniref:hypothetical protein n=1 Tax=Streptomyces sp. NPDC018338 TaxID=3157192 RepID=UPI0033D03634
MLNRIRRAIARTRERYAQKPRHRRALPPIRLTLTHPTPPDRQALPLRQLQARADFLPGEETALVRPYVLAGEQRTRQRSTPLPHRLLAHSCFTPTEVHG